MPQEPFIRFCYIDPNLFHLTDQRLGRASYITNKKPIAVGLGSGTVNLFIDVIFGVKSVTNFNFSVYSIYKKTKDSCYDCLRENRSDIILTPMMLNYNVNDSLNKDVNLLGMFGRSILMLIQDNINQLT